MLRWFGEHWGAPVNDYCVRASIPVGAACDVCGTKFGPGCRGLVLLTDGDALLYHVGCFGHALGSYQRRPDLGNRQPGGGPIGARGKL